MRTTNKDSLLNVTETPKKRKTRPENMFCCWMIHILKCLQWRDDKTRNRQFFNVKNYSEVSSKSTQNISKICREH